MLDTKMNTINDISVQIKNIASYAGGNHLTNEEIENKLNLVAKRLDEVNMNLSIKIADLLNDTDFYYTGLNNQARFFYQRQQNIASHNNGNNELGED